MCRKSLLHAPLQPLIIQDCLDWAIILISKLFFSLNNLIFFTKAKIVGGNCSYILVYGLIKKNYKKMFYNQFKSGYMNVF